MNYYYDRPFYFISINDEKKILIKLSRYITDTRKKINRVPSPNVNYFRQCSSKLSKKNRGSNVRKEQELTEKMSINSSLYFDSRKKVLQSSPFNPGTNKTKEQLEIHTQNKEEVLEKIDEYRSNINKDKFILIIKLLLFIIITGILIIYILNLVLQRKSINIIEKILLTYYYNAETKNIILNIYSKLSGYFHDLSGLTGTKLSATYTESILSYAKELRKYYHNFNKYFIEYNL